MAAGGFFKFQICTKYTSTYNKLFNEEFQRIILKLTLYL